MQRAGSIPFAGNGKTNLKNAIGGLRNKKENKGSYDRNGTNHRGYKQTNQSFVDAIRRQKGALDKLGLQLPEDDNFTWFDNGPDLSSLFSRSVLSLGRVCERVFNAEVARDLTTTALALKRYQLAHGDYPSDLSSLVPRFLPSIPRDPADGQPLRYRLKPDGTFLLYSIGLDGKDNGGDPSPADGKTKSFSWLRGRDLVWPSPGAPEGLAQTHPAGTADEPDRPL